MESANLNCPKCRVQLRIRDRANVGQKFDCPECGQTLSLIDQGKAGISVKLAERFPAPTQVPPRESELVSAAAVKSTARVASESSPVPRTNWKARAGNLAARIGRIASSLTIFRDPLVMVWTSAVAFAIVMLFVLKPWSSGTVESRVGPIVDAPPIAQEKQESAPAEDARPLPEKVPQVAVAPPKKAIPDAKPPAAGVPPQVERIARTPVEAVRPSGAPAAAPAAVPAPMLDPKKALEQPIARYDQSVAVALGDLLLELEVLAAIPIHYDAARIEGLPARLQKPISFSVDRTTVGEVLRTALNQAELDYDVRPDGIHLRALSEANSSEADEKSETPESSEEI